MKGLSSTKTSLALAGIIAMVMSTTAFGYTIYVDDNAAGADIGTDWANALRSLQDAITIAFWLPKPVEIRVARGVYRPDQGAGIARGDREMPFFVLSGMTIKGGYAGSSYLNPDARDIERYKTILSGDLLGNDTVVDDPFDFPWAENRSDNSFTIVASLDSDETAVLDGLIIRDGYADDFDYDTAAGVYNGYADITMIDCIVEDNFAGCTITSMGYGGGMFNYYSNPTLINCTFRRNCVGYRGFPGVFFPSAVGGAIYNFNSGPVLTNCVFDRNYAFDAGGAISDASSIIELTRCTFNANHARGMGGAIYTTSDSNIVMTNCPVTLNSAVYGGAVQSDSSNMNMINCTFADNFSLYGGNGFSLNSDEENPAGNLSFTSCILWNGEEQILNDDESEITISYSDVQGGWDGEGNINEDPLFVEPGFWVHINDPTVVLEPDDPNAVEFDGDYHLQPGSSCIDAGDPNSPVGDEPEPNGGRINMGAYGGTAEATQSS